MVSAGLMKKGLGMEIRKLLHPLAPSSCNRHKHPIHARRGLDQKVDACSCFRLKCLNLEGLERRFRGLVQN
jgi:hypothetical protein